jgi:hypothetical protein
MRRDESIKTSRWEGIDQLSPIFSDLWQSTHLSYGNLNANRRGI